MDTRRGIINVTTSLLFKVVLLVINILVRRYIIIYIGNEINGLHSLYISILNFLSVAELGVGTAVSFCMYKPIVSGDEQKVSALYGLIKKISLLIGVIIFICGCALMPALPYIAKDYQSVEVNLYLTFGLMLSSVVISYFFSAKTVLINAHKKNYVTITINSIGQILQIVLQIIVVITTKSFVGFLLCRVVAILLEWVATEIFTRHQYSNIISNKQKVDAETKKDITNNIKAMFMHKIGDVLVNTTDSMIISAFIGIIILGKYSNYTTIMAAMVGLLTLCFTPLTSVIGHMCVNESKDQIQRYLNFFHAFNFILGVIFFLGYYSVIDDLITILFAKDLELSKSISLIITVNYFIQFMRHSTVLFRDATGTYYYDRWKSIVVGVLNVALSILFVMTFPAEYKVVGVIVSTILTNVFVCHVVEPYVLFKHVIGASVKKFYFKNYFYMIIFVAMLIALHFSMITNENKWIELFANGGISLIFSLAVSAVVIFCSKDFRYYMQRFLQKFFNRINSKHKKVLVEKNTSIDDKNIDNTQKSQDD